MSLGCAIAACEKGLQWQRGILGLSATLKGRANFWMATGKKRVLSTFWKHLQSLGTAARLRSLCRARVASRVLESSAAFRFLSPFAPRNPRFELRLGQKNLACEAHVMAEDGSADDDERH